MKKKLLVLMTIVAIVFSMVGCGTEGLQLLSKMEEVDNWEAATIDENITVDMQVQDAKVKVDTNVAGYMTMKPLKAELTMTMKQVADIEGAEKIEMSLSPVKMYMDGLNVYISSSYFKEIAKISGESESTLNESIDLSKEYIAMDTTSLFEGLGIKLEDLYQPTRTCYNTIKNLNLSSPPITKEGDKYTISLDAKQMINTLCTWVIELLDNQETRALVVEQLEGIDLTEEQIEQVVAEVKSELTDENKAIVEDMIQGSALKVSYDFGKDSYKTDMGLNMNVNMMDDAIIIKMQGNAVCKKADKKEIKMPTNVAQYDYLQMIEDMMAPIVSQSLIISPEDVKVEGDVTYVPTKKVAAAIGAKAIYDAPTKTVYLEMAGHKLPLEVVIEKGVSYITIEDAEALGLSVIVE